MKSITLYGASNRPQNWLRFYSMLRTTTVDFEVIFVGDVRPVFTLPENMRFIYSPVKPAQCHHIAILNSNSEFCMQVCDDIVLSPYAVDYIYDAYKTQHDYRAMTGPRTAPPEEKERDLQWSAYFGGISKRFYKELGGFDNRFIFSQHETDLQFRALIAGGTMVWVSNAWWKEFPRKDDYARACTENSVGFIDWYLLEDLWFEQGEYGSRHTFTGERASGLRPYRNNSTLLTKSQGVTGRWNKNKKWDRNIDSPPLVSAVSKTKPNSPDANLRDIISRFRYKSVDGNAIKIIESKQKQEPIIVSTESPKHNDSMPRTIG